MEHVAPGKLSDDNQAEGLFRVNRRAFTDPHILELEKERSLISAGSTSA